MEKTITLADREHCTGCGACKAICPKSAISFKPDSEGFPSPVIDSEKCVMCRLCERTCPALHMSETRPIHAAYAVQLLDRDALLDSTSGGVFTALSREIFRRGGVIYGCVWDAEYNAIIKRAENEEEIKPMHGSKYVWSWAGDAFPEVKKDLDSGRTVLFTGMPCQAAGLKNYLNKDYENLYVLDFLCSGAPSPIALQSYIKTIAPSDDYTDLNFKFRDKNPYGVGVHISYKGKEPRHKSDHISNPYYYSFYIRLIDRLSCYNCPYGTEKRVSDFTAGDYWGIANYHQQMDIRAGVSALMVNSDKGAALFETIKAELHFEETKAEYISQANNLSIGQRKAVKKPDYREKFLHSVMENGWTAAERKYLYSRTRIKLWIGYSLPVRAVRKISRMIKRISR